MSGAGDLNFIRASADYRTTPSTSHQLLENPMKPRSRRFATVALLSAAFATLAAGAGSAQNHITSASNSAVHSAVTDARDAAFRARDSALDRDVSRTRRRAALR